MLLRLRNLWLALSSLGPLLVDSRRRRTYKEMQSFSRSLPARLTDSLPEALTSLTPLPKDGREGDETQLSADTIRRLADLAALLDRRSPLGLCLRRSLLRYRFLKEAGVPVVVNFGARFKGGRPDREVTGHAWLTLNDRPYFEDSDNYRGFVTMLRHPDH